MAPAPAEEVGARPGLRALARLLPHQHLQAGEWPFAVGPAFAPGAAGRSPGRPASSPGGGASCFAAALLLCPGRWAFLPGTEDGRRDLLTRGYLGEKALLGQLLGPEPGAVALALVVITLIAPSCFLPAPPACVSHGIFAAVLGVEGGP